MTRNLDGSVPEMMAFDATRVESIAQHLPAPFMGTSAAIRAVITEMTFAARLPLNVLITGEYGTGKALVTRLIHQRSSRSRAPFVTVDCAGVPESHVEHELFGTMRDVQPGVLPNGGVSLAKAHQGSLGLREVGRMSPQLQARFSEFLETRQIPEADGAAAADVDVRVIASTTTDLSTRVAAGEFRDDLYYRLNVIHLIIPPLRERREDIPALLDHFVTFYAARYHVEAPVLSSDAVATLVRYSWPGNVTQLRRLAARVVRWPTRTITAQDLPAAVERAARPRMW